MQRNKKNKEERKEGRKILCEVEKERKRKNTS
jgi:hypothetical protein